MESLTEMIGNSGYEITGIRPGEKMHETLINDDEIRNTWELKNNFVIFPPLVTNQIIKNKHPDIISSDKNEAYSSDIAERLSKLEIKNIIKESKVLE
jgi:UDP-N-acetylglucosamine 4,6-dehydratase/5-epimerase